MELLLRLEIYFLFLLYPFIMGMLARRKMIPFKRFLITTITLVSIFLGTLYLYLVTLSPDSSTVIKLSVDDWMTAIGLSVLLWLFLYIMTKPFYKN